MINGPDALQYATPVWAHYGERQLFPDVLHIERIYDRASGLNWDIGLHRHPNLHQFLLIKSGGVTVIAADEEYYPDTPCVISVPAEAVHGFRFAADTVGYVLTVPVMTVPQMIGPDAPPDPVFAAIEILAPNPSIQEAFERIRAEHDARAFGRAPMLQTLAIEISCLFLRFRKSAGGFAPTAPDPRDRKLLNLVEAHAHQHWTVADCAQTIGVSPRHLSRLSVSTLGTTPRHLAEGVPDAGLHPRAGCGNCVSAGVR